MQLLATYMPAMKQNIYMKDKQYEGKHGKVELRKKTS